MAVLWQEIRLSGSKGEKKVNALFDRGATYSIVRKDIAEKITFIDSLPKLMEFGTASKEKKIIIKLRTSMDFYIDDTRFSDEFLVTDEIEEEVIIGAKTMQSWRFKLDSENERVIFDPKVTKLIII